MSTERERIVILGGGLSGMSAAFWLSEEARLTKREYEITVYQPGWRLGGKCASGRNAGAGQRIEEHGLHVWFGMYENAFRTIRRAYEAVNEQTAYSTFKDWRDAFAPQDVWTLEQRIVSELPHWGVFFPPNRLVPGGETTDAPMAAVEADRRRALRRNLWSWVGNAGSVFATGDGGPIWRRAVGSALRAAGLAATAAGPGRAGRLYGVLRGPRRACLERRRAAAPSRMADPRTGGPPRARRSAARRPRHRPWRRRGRTSACDLRSRGDPDHRDGRGPSRGGGLGIGRRRRVRSLATAAWSARIDGRLAAPLADL